MNTGETKHGHKTKIGKYAPKHQLLYTPDNDAVSYIRIEYNQQIKRMEKLGILVDAQMFEQCVNQLLTIVEDKMSQRDIY